MADYIKCAEVLKDFEACNAENPRWTPQRVKTLLMRQPVADVVEVVRCKDCKYRRKNDENEPYCTAKDGLSDPWDDEFCSHGERNI